MEINSKNVRIDWNGWPNLTINENGKSLQVFINFRNVVSISIENGENTITIQTIDKIYKILCDRNDFCRLKELIERYFINKNL